MDEYIRVTAKSVEDAILEASITLGTTRDNIEVRILERETRGFLGIGAKKAVIEARRKLSEEDMINEVFREKEAETTKKSKKKEESPEKKAAKKAEKKAGKESKEAEKSGKKEEKAAAKAEKKEEKAVKAEKKEEKASAKAEKGSKKASKEEKPSKEEKASAREEKESQAKETKAEKKAAKADAKAEKAVARQTPESAPAENTPKVPADPEVVMSRAQEFLSAMLQAMGVEATVRTSYEDGTLNVNLEGEDMGILIGKRGQTLDSIQYLTSLVVNKGKAAYVRVKIDTENYRERRKATLENLAKNMAFKVKKTRRPAYLEPMNPYERRIIHSALQDDPYVTTHSEGEEPARKVVITLRRHERENAPGEVTDVIEETFEEETL